MRLPFLFALAIQSNPTGALSSFSSGSTSSSSTTAWSPQINQPPQSSSSWKPKVKNLEERRTLRGKKHNSETIGSLGFHHIEFYCGDAKSMSQIFSTALGMSATGTTGQHTGNDQCISYGLESGNVRFLLTAPYSQQVSSSSSLLQSTTTTTTTTNDVEFDAPNPLPGFVPREAHQFFAKHGLAARAIAIQVKDASNAFEAAVDRGAEPVLEPTTIQPCAAQKKLIIQDNEDDLLACQLAEVKLYGDVVLRFLSFPKNNKNNDNTLKPIKGDAPKLPFMPHLAPTGKQRPSFGLTRIDHAVGNVPNLAKALEKISAFTGFHEFAEFTPEDIGTLESGLNSVVLASDTENVLLPLNEPTEGKRKSQILTYLEQNEGAGLQHLALKTDDIFKTISHMRRAEEEMLGFELMRRPSDEYYQELPNRLGDQLTEDQYKRLEELGILGDADDEGILLQIFTKPIGDRPTFFIEIIQRIGCQYTPEEANPEEEGEDLIAQRPGCGGFGQGNFRELFKSIEDYEKTLKV